MNVYLKIAEDVLKKSSTALSASEILDRAYSLNIMPPHLYGQTQYKTLHARLAEDLLSRGINSFFYRTSPGRFFLRNHPKINNPYSDIGVEFFAPKRKRELKRGRHLSICKSKTDYVSGEIYLLNNCNNQIRNVTEYDYFKNIKNDANMAAVTSFVIFVRPTSILTHRLGKYITDHDQITNKKTIGFQYFIAEDYNDIFNQIDMGVQSASVGGIVEDLGVEKDFSLVNAISDSCQLKGVLMMDDYPDFGDLLVYLYICICPDGYEPTSKKLAINDLLWTSINNQPNNIEEYEPISRVIYQQDLLKEMIS